MPRSSPRRCLPIAAALAGAYGPSAHAMERSHFDLCATADAIVVARVSDISSTHTGPPPNSAARTPIHSRLTFETIGYFMGENAPRFETVVLGGEVGAVGMHVGGTPAFERDQVFVVPLATTGGERPEHQVVWHVLDGYIPLETVPALPPPELMNLAWRDACLLNPGGIPKGGVGFGGRGDSQSPSSAGSRDRSESRSQADPRRPITDDTDAQRRGGALPFSWPAPDPGPVVGPPWVVTIENIAYGRRSPLPRVTIGGTVYRVPFQLPYFATGIQLPAWSIEALEKAGTITRLRTARAAP